MTVHCRDTSDGQYCYAGQGASSKFHDAKKFCNEVSGDLVTPKSSEDTTFILNKFGRTYFWLGIENPNGDNTKWVYSYDLSEDISYTNWHQPDEPNTNSEKCVQMRADGTWNDAHCDNSHKFICQFKVDPLSKFLTVYSNKYIIVKMVLVKSSFIVFLVAICFDIPHFL